MRDQQGSELRKKVEGEIFEVLFTKPRLDRKFNYCRSHAEERAKVIESSLFTNCRKMYEDWESLYENIDVDLLVDKVEQKTVVCVYR